MTDIERLKATKDFLKERYNEDLKNCKHPELKPLIKETYHENIKAFNIAISALEKQIPRKPIEDRYPWCICPNCGGSVYLKHIQEHISNGETSHCEHCGQALDWSDSKCL